ncbi:MAG: SET domain-containing protein-lysine N-methyltransferase [Flavobacteriales bacterium]|nr:SET domain-containing protein-lysine N-methyltransferase [Flavobacteriales bacterium]
MIHPDTEIRQINETIGVGVFATKRIPKGTIVFALDPLDIVLPGDDPLIKHPGLGSYIEKYSFRDEQGRRILSVDHAKYVNHHCSPNTLCTAWGFDIAVRDIEAGDELTCDYGLLNIESNMECMCGDPGCRLVIAPHDGLMHSRHWNKVIKQALKSEKEAKQPLAFLLSPVVKAQLEKYLQTGKGYISVEKMVYLEGNSNRKIRLAS